MLADRFSALKNMEQFTNDMFNRIISFQEKDHPAWNESLPFSTRISGLPLHNLIFSNPDRDPTIHGPTIAPYYPQREEMIKLAGYAKQCSSDPVVYDWFPGNGFIGSLLAREGISVTGIENTNLKANQIASFYDKDCYRFTNRHELDTTCDLILASWIPSEINPTPDFLALTPKIIAYVYTDHVNETNGKRQCGTTNMFDSLQDQYLLLDSWHVHRLANLLHDIWPDMTPNIEETRIVRVYARKDINIQKVESKTPESTYDWEKDLQMALLANEAKQQLRSQGMQV